MEAKFDIEYEYAVDEEEPYSAKVTLNLPADPERSWRTAPAIWGAEVDGERVSASHPLYYSRMFQAKSWASLREAIQRWEEEIVAALREAKERYDAALSTKPIEVAECFDI